MNYALVTIIKTPGAFDEPLTYLIPDDLKAFVKIGQGVWVSLKNKSVRGIVIGLLPTAPQESSTIKPIERLMDDLILRELDVMLAKKMATYYQTSILRCLKLMVPSFLWKGKGVRILKSFEKQKSSAVPEKFPLKSLKHALTPDQQQALQQIQKSEKPVLLHGITGSGKTEIFLHLALEMAKKGRQTILMVPEIALTPQMIDYFSQYFGDHLALFHSKLSDGERLKEWLKVKSGQAPLVIGSRSAIFAPAPALGAIIIDEEHEWTYKQESSPYYQAHWVAETLHELTGCHVLLATATPRLETWYKAENKVYQKVELLERINQKSLPLIHLVDLREEFQKKNYSIFSDLLRLKMRDRFQKQEQVILFVNQRGFARAVVCRDCGYTLHCPHCEVALKLHQFGSTEKLLCHYCSYQQELPLSCPQCQSVHIRHVGVGTQRVEQELRVLFPEARILRADQDTTSDKQGFEPLYHAFKNREFDFLVGTQMVAKGLNFPEVTLIGIILADIGLHLPDFRSHERVFHLITQVAGRAGRSEKQGEVVLQTYQPQHHAIKMAAHYQFKEFVEKEMAFRKQLQYPPFSQLIKFVVLGKDLEKLKIHLQAEKELLEDLAKIHEQEVRITYAPAMIPRVNGFYYYQFLVRSPSMSELLRHWQVPKSWRIDVDPIHTI